MFVTLDFETYYDDEYSLSKMTTDAYIMDPRFKVHGVGIKIGEGDTRWFNERRVNDALTLIPWEDTIVCAHNMCFDGFILTQRYGRYPRFYVDTLSMARYMIGASVGGSLAATAQHFNLGVKGRELINSKGKRNLTAEESKTLGGYCINDTNLCHAAFKVMRPSFPMKELRNIDMLMRMFCEPKLVLDEQQLEQYYQEVVDRKREILLRAGLNDREVLMSDAKLAAVFTALGVDPPTKVSPRTGLETFAFAKTDPGMKELLEHENDEVRWIAEARVGVKSTIEESRAARLLAIAKEKRPFPVMLLYYGAHTGRYSGANKMNPQNLKRGGVLRRCLQAPPGYVVLSCDSSQIEARLTAYVAGQHDLVQDFRDKVDIYSKFSGENVYHEPVTKKDTEKRFVGKTCILGLGFGMGPPKFKATLALGVNGPVVHIEDGEAIRIVQAYRRRYDRITHLWDRMDNALYHIASGGKLDDGFIQVSDGKLWLPNGMAIQYHGLHRNENNEWIFMHRKKPTKTYGGKATENLIQGLAKVVVTDQMLKIQETVPDLFMALMVHDEPVMLVKEERVEEVVPIVEEIMSTPPDWAPDLPVACESGYGRSYGEC